MILVARLTLIFLLDSLVACDWWRIGWFWFHISTSVAYVFLPSSASSSRFLHWEAFSWLHCPSGAQHSCLRSISLSYLVFGQVLVGMVILACFDLDNSTTLFLPPAQYHSRLTIAFPLHDYVNTFTPPCNGPPCYRCGTCLSLLLTCPDNAWAW